MIPADDTPSLREELKQRSGQSSLQQIFVGEQSIGGFTDLEKALESGELYQLIGD